MALLALAVRLLLSSDPVSVAADHAAEETLRKAGQTDRPLMDAAHAEPNAVPVPVRRSPPRELAQDSRFLVVDDVQISVPDVEIVVTSYRTHDTRSHVTIVDERLSVRSDASGHFSVPERFLGTPNTFVRAKKEGYLPYQGKLDRSAEAAVTLRRTTTLLGSVLELNTNRPFVGARIGVSARAMQLSASWGGHTQKPEWWTTTSDREGFFRLDDLGVGTPTTLLIGARGNLPTRHSVLLSAPDEPRKTFLITSVAQLICRAFEITSGQPVAGATVQVMGLEITSSRGDGSFEIGGLREGGPLEAVTVTVAAAGYATTSRKLDPTQIVPRMLEPFPMIAGCHIEGRVTDPSGRPVANAQVSVEIAKSPRPDWIARQIGHSLPSGTSLIQLKTTPSTRTDLEGRYRLGPLVPFAQLEYVEATDRATRQRLRNGPHRLQRPGQTLRLDFAFPSLPGALEGTLTLNGKPLRARIGWRQSDRFGSAISADDGRFRVEGIPPGRTVVEVSVFRPQLMRNFDVVIGAGATMRRDFVLTADTSFVSGRVTDYAGRPLGAVPVQATSSQPDRVARCQTGPDGRFQLELPPGTKSVRVMAGAPHQAVTRFNVAPGSEGLEFTLSE